VKKADRIYFGGDYNPDQWDEKTIDEDMELFKQAGVNLVVLPVFSWAKLEPSEGEYHFEWLDHLIDKIWAHGIHVCLATPTTAQPAWLSKKYPEVLPVDIAGRKRTHGMRVFFCVNSLKYRERAAAIAEEMAKRYAHHPALAAWHVSNEYGTSCYCPACQAKFRLWLKQRYGTIENLNKMWHTSFWGRTVYEFDEIMLPTELNDDYRFNPVIQLDYMRFLTDSTAECFENEAKVLRKYNPEIPVMTNMSGYIRKLDQRVMADHLDMVGWDNYPAPTDPPYFVAMKHEIMRGLRHGQSYWLTEQSPNQQNWQPYNKLKRPGEVRKLSYQAIAHGADTCLFFQMRQSVAGQEQFHGAFINHGGHGNTRIFREMTTLGKELESLKDKVLEGRIQARAAILFDWNNWWALELSSGPSKDMDYLKLISEYYRAFHEQNIPVDIIRMDEELDRYDLVVAPLLHMMKEKIGERVEQFVENGGTFVATMRSGIADEENRCIFGDYPGPLKKVLGIRVEETDALRPEEENLIVMKETSGMKEKTYACSFLCDLIYPEGAETLAVYGKDFYEGVACLTKNNYGKGRAYYIGTQAEPAFLKEWIQKICEECGITSLYETSEGVELTNRVSEKADLVFVINNSQKEGWIDLKEERLKNLLTQTEVTGKVSLKAEDVLVLERQNKGGE
jgi:beta-galactosidase